MKLLDQGKYLSKTHHLVHVALVGLLIIRLGILVYQIIFPGSNIIYNGFISSIKFAYVLEILMIPILLLHCAKINEKRSIRLLSMYASYLVIAVFVVFEIIFYN